MDCEIHKGDGKSEEIIEDELVFVDIPEFSCFNILGDATIETSQLVSYFHIFIVIFFFFLY